MGSHHGWSDMATYIDTASGQPEDSLGAWFEENLLDTARTFLAQSAWLSYGTLEPFAHEVERLIDQDARIALVVGSNGGSLTKLDLDRLWALISPGAQSRLAVVRYRNAVFHPKVFYVEREDGSRTAVVGSANLTPGGTERNIEAGVILDTHEGDSDVAFDKIADAVSAWFDRDEDGVFPIANQAAIDALADDGVIDVAQPKKEIEPEQPAGKEDEEDGAGRRPAKLGIHKRFWKPPRKQVPPTPTEPEMAVANEQDEGEDGTVGGTTTAPPAPAAPGIPEERWGKLLKGTDAQQPPQQGTNPTGKLRLTKSQFDIDHKTFFREDFFGDETWETEVRGNQTYEVAMVEFDVIIDGVNKGTHSLMVDHAPHRVAGQNNVPTVLAWGPELGRDLGQNSKVGEWVTVERFDGPRYVLTIQPNKPTWA